MFLVDVNSIPDINIGDEVVLIGKQGKRRISVTSFSEMTNFINYELLSRIPANIPKKNKRVEKNDYLFDCSCWEKSGNW